MRNHPPTPLLLALLALAGASLACTAVTSQLPGFEPPAEPTQVPPLDLPVPEPTRAPQAASGPTVGTPRETRLAINDNVLTLEVLAAESYTQEDFAQVDRTFDYTIRLQQDEPLLWFYGWCATDQTILADNLEKMRIELVVDDRTVDENQLVVFEGESDNLPCRYFAAVLRDWPPGTSVVETRITYTALVDDGISAYPPGKQIFHYEVTR